MRWRDIDGVTSGGRGGVEEVEGENREWGRRDLPTINLCSVGILRKWPVGGGGGRWWWGGVKRIKHTIMQGNSQKKKNTALSHPTYSLEALFTALSSFAG